MGDIWTSMRLLPLCYDHHFTIMALRCQRPHTCHILLIIQISYVKNQLKDHLIQIQNLNGTWVRISTVEPLPQLEAIHSGNS